MQWSCKPHQIVQRLTSTHKRVCPGNCITLCHVRTNIILSFITTTGSSQKDYFECFMFLFVLTLVRLHAVMTESVVKMAPYTKEQKVFMVEKKNY